ESSDRNLSGANPVDPRVVRRSCLFRRSVKRRRTEREDGLARKTIDDVDQLGEALSVFVRTLSDAVRHTFFDVKLEDDMADAPDRRFRRRKLLQNGDT